MMYVWGGINYEGGFRYTEKGIIVDCACGTSYWWEEQKKYVHSCPTCRSRLRVIMGDAADKVNHE